MVLAAFLLPMRHTGASADILNLNLPGISLSLPGVSTALATLGNTAAPLVLNPVNTVNATAARLTGASAVGLVDQGLGQLLNNAITGTGQPVGTLPPGPNGGVVPSANLGIFGAASVTYAEHAGYTTHFAGQNGTTDAVRTRDAAVIPALQFDVSQHFDAAPGKVIVAFFAGGRTSEIEARADPLLQQAGFARAGVSHLETFEAGGYGLALWGNSYGAVLAAGDWGSVDTRDDVIGSQSNYGTHGGIAALTLGHVVPVASGWRIDLRSQLAFEQQTNQNNTDSTGVAYSGIDNASLTGNLSARAFTVIAAGGITYRPFLQLGVEQRFYNLSEATIGTTRFTYDDASTTTFGRVGLDLELGKNLQTYVSVRGDTNRDQRSVTGQAGLLFKFN